ncbi:nucleoside recognition GATE domain-containing membrane protein YjiH [Dethiosulfatibacter aminovorans DSM 17477]|uniref:Nucleoside recognition GATE domain-containing membrane protein YjiH n=1 Tax=Dethiosulfatibacter aminovorans DSM 17477 TaxID=1121476 RepID=A0A1M6ML02_9FIRM|nr:nucleoside recognition domain-containing protein [Dethiosulfatibacter aminovorans]SHJ84151.1 nucleoside recognition GATE domain-containing membrane protein YjiH [Dethiosulfatibacter aminovorans DSM 17477]
MIPKKSRELQLELKSSYNRALFLFLFGSLSGIVIFFVKINGKFPFEIMYKALLSGLGGAARYIILIYPILMLAGFIYAKKYSDESSRIYQFFKEDKKFHGIVYALSSVLAIMIYLQAGISMLYGDKAAGFMVTEILPYTITIIPVGGAVLPLLASFGLLDVIGGVLEPIMRPAFKVPGKSALDTIASVVGAAVVGIFLTASLYKEKHYTTKEALSIATGFSLNSVGYCAFCVGYVGLIDKFNIMFLMYLVITYLISAIMVRLYPIRKYPDVYVDGSIQTDEMRTENVSFNVAQIKKGYYNAIRKADSSEGLAKEVSRGFVKGIGVSMQVVPMMLAIGGVFLAINEFTPVFEILSKPFIPIISLLGVPEPVIAAQAIFVGGLDLFLPSAVIGPALVPDATKFFVVMISLMQVLYITETMLPIIFFGIPAKFKDLLIIWFMRTVIAMPFVAACMHLVY